MLGNMRTTADLFNQIREMACRSFRDVECFCRCSDSRTDKQTPVDEFGKLGT